MLPSPRRACAPLLALALLLALAAPTHAQAATPIVLLLHGGGWHGGDPASMDAWRDDFEAHGYRTRSIAYPLGSVTRSIDFVDAIAQQERRAGAPVIAYGISAGGTIAAALAASGRVSGAVDLLGPTDFTSWLSPIGMEVMLAVHMSGAEKRAASPLRRLNGRQTPQLLQCGLLDPVTTYDQCTRYVSAARRGNPDTTLHTLVSVHVQSTADRDRARAWVQARWPARNWARRMIVLHAP
jgi:acetyl esterase/lipase